MPDPAVVNTANEIQTLAQNGVPGAIAAGVVLLVRELIERSRNGKNGKDGKYITSDICEAHRKTQELANEFIKDALHDIKEDLKRIVPSK